MSINVAPPAIETNSAATTAAETPKSGPGRRLGWAMSFTVLALLLVFAVDMGLRAAIQIDAYRQSNRSWVWWMVKALRQNPNAEVAMCGSSLMVATVDETDATYLNHTIDQVLHWRCEYLEHCLLERNGHLVRTADLAMGGQMASDVYAVVTTLMHGAHQPKIVVWGIAPRDFVDSTFTYPNASETVRYMTRINGGKEIFTSGRSFWDRVEQTLDKAMWSYGNRDQVVFLQHRILKGMLARLGWNNLEEDNLPQKLRQYADENLAEDVGIDHWGVAPYYKGMPFSDNRGEYKMRYNPFRPNNYQFQLHYFDKTLEFCRANHIRVVLVNMPLMKANMDLMPAGMYQNYLQDTARVARGYGISMLDLNKPGLFPDGYFRDYVHMNGLGGKKFWQIVLEHWPSQSH
ncbi:MAG TPA: hypothetical protein V6C69_19615 [Trichormus sp.]|jgi:hypothetical protein